MRCGWCQGPANTGLGVCREGGFLASQNTSACPASRWFFDECPGTLSTHRTRTIINLLLPQLASVMDTVFVSMKAFVLTVRTTPKVLSLTKQHDLLFFHQVQIVSSVWIHSMGIPEMDSSVQVHCCCRTSSLAYPFSLVLHSVCDCNGYNTTCNSTNGNCVCSNVGVSGPRCGQ